MCIPLPFVNTSYVLMEVILFYSYRLVYWSDLFIFFVPIEVKEQMNFPHGMTYWAIICLFSLSYALGYTRIKQSQNGVSVIVYNTRGDHRMNTEKMRSECYLITKFKKSYVRLQREKCIHNLYTYTCRVNKVNWYKLKHNNNKLILNTFC